MRKLRLLAEPDTFARLLSLCVPQFIVRRRIRKQKLKRIKQMKDTAKVVTLSALVVLGLLVANKKWGHKLSPKVRNWLP